MKEKYLMHAGTRSLVGAIMPLLLVFNLTAQSRRADVSDLRQKMRLVRIIDTPLHKYGHIHFNATGERIVTKDNVYGIRIFNANTGELETTISPCGGGKKFASGFFDESERFLAVGCEETGKAEIWNIQGSRKIREFRIQQSRTFSKLDFVFSTISPDAATLVLYDSHAEPTELWHIEAGRKIATLTPFLTKGWRDSDTVEFGPDSRVVAVSYGTDLYLWDTRTGKMLFHLVDPNLSDGRAIAHKSLTYYLMFSHDGEYLFSGSLDTKVKQWSTTTGKLIRTFSGHKDRILSLALSPDRKTLATGSRDEKAKLWDVETGRLLWTSPSHKSYVWKIFFSPDGKRFLTMTGSGDIGSKNEILMWETATGKLLGKMPSIWWQSFFSPDWKRFVTVGKKKGTIELYEFIE